MEPSTPIIPFGYCHCGCGQKTRIARQTCKARGTLKGQPVGYVHGHNRKGDKHKPESVFLMRKVHTRHGHVPNRKPSRTFVIWQGIKQRCLNPRTRYYADYGGRGILVCERWMQFENFLADMREAPEGFSIDRINNDGHYEPANCRWATIAEQSVNKRSNRRLEWRGSSYTISELTRVLGYNRFLVGNRLRRGWSIDRIADTPPSRKYDHKRTDSAQ